MECSDVLTVQRWNRTDTVFATVLLLSQTVAIQCATATILGNIVAAYRSKVYIIGRNTVCYDCYDDSL